MSTSLPYPQFQKVIDAYDEAASVHCFVIRMKNPTLTDAEIIEADWAEIEGLARELLDLHIATENRGADRTMILVRVNKEGAL